MFVHKAGRDSEKSAILFPQQYLGLNKYGEKRNN